MFSPKLWEMIFRGVLLPIFNNIGYSKGKVRFPDESQEWLSTTCPHAFRLLVDIFSNFVETIDFLTNEILQLLISCILQNESEDLLRLGAQSFLRMASGNGSKFSENVWDLVTSKIEHTFQFFTADPAGKNLVGAINESQNFIQMARNASLQTIRVNSPKSTPIIIKPSLEITNSKSTINTPTSLSPQTPLLTVNSPTPQGALPLGSPQSPSNVPRKLPGILTLNLVVQIVDTLSNSYEQYPNLNFDHFLSMAKCLNASYQFCKNVSIQIPNFSKLDGVDLITSTELSSSTSYLRILFLLYSGNSGKNRPPNSIVDVEKILIRRCFNLIKEYLNKERISVKVIVQVLTSFLNMDENQFTSHLGTFYKLFLQLMLDENEDVRRVLRLVFQRIGKIKGVLIVDANAKANALSRPAPVSVQS